MQPRHHPVDVDDGAVVGEATAKDGGNAWVCRGWFSAMGENDKGGGSGGVVSIIVIYFAAPLIVGEA